MLKEERDYHWSSDRLPLRFVHRTSRACSPPANPPLISALLGMLYLYGMWTERRKRSPKTEENEPLSNGSKTTSDCEKGITEESENENVDDYVVRPLGTGLCGMLLTNVPYRFSYPSTEHRCPGGIQLRILPFTTDLPASPNIRNLERSEPWLHIRSTEP